MFVFGCSSGVRLSGTWVQKTQFGDITIEFEGNNFTLIEYPARAMRRYGWEWEGNYGSLVGKVSFSEPLTFEDSSLTLLSSNVQGNMAVEFYKRETKGTYSISDANQIELTFSRSGKIDVFSFSRTENTIAIKGERFTLRK